jgi:hypothetical protein
MCAIGECSRPAAYKVERQGGPIPETRYTCGAALCMVVGVHRTANKDQFAVLVTPV